MAMSNLYSKIAQMKRNSEPANMSFSQTHWINGEKCNDLQDFNYFFVECFQELNNFLHFNSEQWSSDVATTQQCPVEPTWEFADNSTDQQPQLSFGLSRSSQLHIVLFTVTICAVSHQHHLEQWERWSYDGPQLAGDKANRQRTQRCYV